MSEVSAHTSKLSLAAIAVVIFASLFFGNVWLVVDQHRLRRDVEMQTMTTVEEIDKLVARVDKQTAVMNRALGKHIPVVMPDEWEKKLKGLEEQLKNSADWPKDQKSAQTFFENTSALVKSLPPWAEDDYLTRLNSMRWAAQGFVHLQSPVDGKACLASADELRDLADIMPDTGSTELLTELQRVAGERATKGEQAQRENALAKAIDTANAYINNAATGSDDVTGADALLQQYESQGRLDNEAQNLRRQLHTTIHTRQALQNAGGLKARWEKIRALKETHPSVHEAGVQMLLAEAVAARTASAMEDIVVPEYEEVEAMLRQTIADIAEAAGVREEERNAKAIREYQRWALEEIKNFDSGFDAAAEAAAKNARTFKADNSGWSDERYDEVRIAMEKHLLPVNSALLELPVNERHQRAFQKGWSKLDGREDQTKVAAATVTTKKRDCATSIMKPRQTHWLSAHMTNGRLHRSIVSIWNLMAF